MSRGTGVTLDGIPHTGAGATEDGSIGVRKSDSATLSAGDTYVDVTHGLGGTPSRVQLTPTSNLGGRTFWISDKGATTFRINISSSDLEDHTFDWEAY